jgi:hypothetical protein
MSLEMPPSFPRSNFQRFGEYAVEFLPKPLSDEWLSDELQRRQQFDRAFEGVLYRYRSCSEANDEFVTLVRGADETWGENGADRELAYRLDRSLYAFYTNGLSIFESFGFCLYIIGSALRGQGFPYASLPRKINLRETKTALAKTFSPALIADRLQSLLTSDEFKRLEEIRNILAHRVSGMTTAQYSSTVEYNNPIDWKSVGNYSIYTKEEFWYLPGTNKQRFDQDLTQRTLDWITSILVGLIDSAVDFLISQSQPPRR